LTLISNSDAHWLDWMGKVITIFELAEQPSVAELRRALRGDGDRRAYVP
jgi:PHP family Zn ribbon phosphoesterase